MRVVAIHATLGTGKDEFAEAFRRRGFAICAFADPIKVIARDVWGCDPADLWGPSERRGAEVPGDIFVWRCACGRWQQRQGVLCRDMECNGELLPSRLTIRDLLQYLGTEIGRGIDPNCWVRAMERRIEVLRTRADASAVYTHPVWNGRDRTGTAWPDCDACIDPNDDDEWWPYGIVISDLRFDNEAKMALRKNAGVIKLTRAGVEPKNSAHASEAGIDPDLISQSYSVPTVAPDAVAALYDDLAQRVLDRMDHDNDHGGTPHDD